MTINSYESLHEENQISNKIVYYIDMLNPCFTLFILLTNIIMFGFIVGIFHLIISNDNNCVLS
jgi:hypothetical protein